VGNPPGFDLLPGLHVLVVDDNRDARDIFRTVLQYCGALVSTVSSARAALKLLEHVKPDLLLSDLAMPGKDGEWLIRNVRKLRKDRGAEIPALAVSAHDDAYLRETILAAGFQDYLVKPVNFRELCQAINRLTISAQTGR
jgi:CheY-like chemotaxis protein